MLVIASHFGLLDPKRTMRTRGWRRIGTAIVRWPGPILVVDARDRPDRSARAARLQDQLRRPAPYLPDRAPANVGYAAAERHFSKARLNPELLMIETDHDLRNPTDMILLERVAKAVFHTDGIAQVQSITRPLGTPLDHTLDPVPDQRAERRPDQEPAASSRPAPRDLLKQVDEITKSINILRQQYALQQQPAPTPPHEQVEAFHDTVATVTGSARQDRQLRRLLPAAAQLLLLGAALFRHPDLLRRCGRCSTRSTASTR